MNITRKSTLAVAGTLAGLALTVAAAPTSTAAAAAAVPVDRPLIVGGTIDFGSSYANGVPTTGGHLRWKTNQLGVVTPTLTGNLKVDLGFCGRIQVEYFNPVNHNGLGTRATAVQCGPSTTLVRVNNFSHAAARHVHINLQRQNPNGTFTTIGSVTEDR